MKMFGGIVDWKDCKENTVTMSTTKAELLSLSNGGHEVCWWMRFSKLLVSVLTRAWRYFAATSKPSVC